MLVNSPSPVGAHLVKATISSHTIIIFTLLKLFALDRGMIKLYICANYAAEHIYEQVISLNWHSLTECENVSFS